LERLRTGARYAELIFELEFAALVKGLHFPEHRDSRGPNASSADRHSSVSITNDNGVGGSEKSILRLDWQRQPSDGSTLPAPMAASLPGNWSPTIRKCADIKAWVDELDYNGAPLAMRPATIVHVYPYSAPAVNI